MAPWLRYLIAFVVGCHGFIYFPFGMVAVGELKEWKGRSLLLGSAITGRRLKELVRTLHVIAGCVILTAAVAVALATRDPGLWRPLAIVGALLGIMAFVPFWDGDAQLLVQEGSIGAVVSLILLVGALVFPGAFG
jgi:hypothetical protein